MLANEQVVDGRGERSGALVEVRQLTQWFFRITDYADRLLADLDAIRWPEHVKTMQRNWIGRSEGAEVVFRNEELRSRPPSRLHGLHDPSGHAVRRDVLRHGARASRRAAPRRGHRARGGGARIRQRALTADKTLRGDVDKPKTGVALGRTVTNPVNGEQLPMYVADYVLMEYGTGAIMAVPAHDARDFAFAQAYALPIRRVIEGP